jgi:hypothetical protein
MPIRRAGLALVSVKLSLSAGVVSYSTLPSSLPILTHSLPPPYAQASRSVHHCPVLMLSSCSLGSIKGIQRSVFPTDHHIKCTLHLLMHPPPLPCLLASEDTGLSGRSCKSLFFSKKTLTSVGAIAITKYLLLWTCTSLSRQRATRGQLSDRGKERGQTEKEFMMAVLCCCCFLR